MDIFNMIGGLLDQFGSHILPHAPFIGVAFVLAVIGQHVSLRVFTRPKAYKNYGNSAAGKWKWRFYYWGRETLPLQPIIAGMLIGIVWVDPEQRGWTRPSTIGYFATAGTLSLFLWAIVKGLLKKRGIEIALPIADSVPPDKLPYDEEGTPVVLDEAGRIPIAKLPSLDPSPLGPESLPPPPEDGNAEEESEKVPTLPPVSRALRDLRRTK